jgi:enamine deaminase RidA (YjgF/YER057c/UK114 family)
MPKSAIKPEGIPVLGIYTPAFKVSDGELIILSGVVGVDADGKTVGIGDAAVQARQALNNIKAVLEAAGASLDDVIHVRIFSTDMRNRTAINAERRKVFRDPMPASTHVQVVRLVNEEWLLEIEATAFVSRAGHS